MADLSRKKTKSSYRTVFRKARKVVKKNIVRLFIESILMLSFGSYIFIYLQKIPTNYENLEIISKMFSNYLLAFTYFYNAFKETIIIVFVFLLALLCILLFLGSFWRIIKIISKSKASKKYLK